MKHETNDLSIETLNKYNIDKVIDLQKEIFPLEYAKYDFIDSINNSFPNYFSMIKYYAVYKKNNLIGICGIYSYTEYPNDAWLGWFGVIEKERRRGYGTKILEFVFDEAKKMGFENLRLYTDEIDNAIAVKLYEKFGMTREYYNNLNDKHYEVGKTLIFSKNLKGNKIPLWNNKYLYLDQHDKRNNII